MLSIDKFSYQILKTIYYNSKRPTTLADLHKKYPKKSEADIINSCNILYNNGYIKYLSVDLDKNNNIIIDYSTYLITASGKACIENETLENKRHWQNIFMPQILNVVVSVITTICTFFILQWLSTR